MAINLWGKWWSRYCESKRSIKLEHQLRELLQNRSDIVQQAIELQKRQHPGQPESWYWDKVIYDLEREA